jgi:hypothetical protein
MAEDTKKEQTRQELRGIALEKVGKIFNGALELYSSLGFSNPDEARAGYDLMMGAAGCVIHYHEIFGEEQLIDNRLRRDLENARYIASIK